MMKSTSNPKAVRVPLSVRLNDQERKRLKRLAGNKPLGTYIRDRLLNESAADISRSDETRKLLGQILAELGKAQQVSVLSEITDKADAELIELSPDMEATLVAASADLSKIRLLLLKALGLRAGE